MSRRRPTGYSAPSHRGPIRSWPDAEYDAALHLLDRQIVDVDGRLVGKVDDVELTEDDGALVPTALLVGAPALLPRFGGRLGRWLAERYEQLAPAEAARLQPGVIDLDLVDDVTSEVHLRVERAGLVRRRVEDHGPAPARRRLGRLLQLRVLLPGGTTAGGPSGAPAMRVLDVHLTGNPDRPGRQQVAALVVGEGRSGSLLGYDRSDDQGPWLVATAVRWLHRRTRVVQLGPEVDIVWTAGEVRVGPGAEVRRLRGGGAVEGW